jgi:predicted nuclease of predicted toxin-antitoxin system
MKFLIDAQLPPGLCRWMEARGHDAEHVFDRAMGGASDADIASYAQSAGAVLISKDEDFLYLRLLYPFPFLWLRCGNATSAALGIWLEERWPRVEKLLAAGETLIELL